MNSTALVGCLLAILSVQATALRVSRLSTDPVAPYATWETAATVTPYGASGGRTPGGLPPLRPPSPGECGLQLARNPAIHEPSFVY